MDKVNQIIPSSTERSYSCELCKDVEMIPEKDEEGNVRYRPCPCVFAKQARKRMEESGLKESIDTYTFDSFETKTTMQKTMKDTARRYLDTLIKEWKSPRRPWLYVGGNPGSGKTHICTAVCGELLKANVRVVYMQWLDEARKLKFCVNDDNFDELVEDYINVPVLYIDDFLKQKYTNNPVFTEADIKIAFTILNGRYIRNNPTIISSEWSLVNQLMAADEGVFSRVYERCKGYTVNISRNQQNNYRMTGGSADG